MLDVEDIIRTALLEDGYDHGVPFDTDTFVDRVVQQLKDVHTIEPLTRNSKPLSLVSFQCMLQDTGYPLELYMVPSNLQTGTEHNVARNLRERWIGWAIEIPGQQKWTESFPSQHNLNEVEDETRADTALKKPPEKCPSFARRDEYVGALVKVYNAAANFKPASLFTFVGILSSATLPCAFDREENDASGSVPAIHVLTEPSPILPSSFVSTHSFGNDVGQGDSYSSIRDSLIQYLSSAFPNKDLVAAELLLLVLLSSPISRPPHPLLGTFALNLTNASSPELCNFLVRVIQSVMPMVVQLPLSIELLHATNFCPFSTDSTSLDAGVLQLGAGTVLTINQDAVGEGGRLNEKATSNLKSLAECMSTQSLQYQYPFMENLRMDCALRHLVFSESTSFLPVDFVLPLESHTDPDPVPALDEQSSSLTLFRRYLADHGSASHAGKVNIPEDISQRIQDDFVTARQTPEDRLDAEQCLKRRMRVARLLAQSFPDAILSTAVWEHAVELDQAAQWRLTLKNDRTKKEAVNG